MTKPTDLEITQACAECQCGCGKPAPLASKTRRPTMTPEEMKYLSNPEMQKKFNWEPEIGDHFIDTSMKDDVFFVGTKVLGFIVDTNEYMHNPYKCVWLPLPIDSVNPERGIVGMLQSCEGIFSYILEWQPGLIDGWRVSIKRKFLIRLRKNISLSKPISHWNLNIKQYEGNTPCLALLKALATQWGIEI